MARAQGRPAGGVLRGRVDPEGLAQEIEDLGPGRGYPHRLARRERGKDLGLERWAGGCSGGEEGPAGPAPRAAAAAARGWHGGQLATWAPGPAQAVRWQWLP